MTIMQNACTIFDQRGLSTITSLQLEDTGESTCAADADYKFRNE